MKVTYENAAKEITLEQAINAYKYGIATIITDGRDVAFEIENVSTGFTVKVGDAKCLE